MKTKPDKQTRSKNGGQVPVKGQSATTGKDKSLAKGHAASVAKGDVPRRPWLQRLPLLPIPLVVFLLLWWWTACWQGDVFRLVRENSFFAPSDVLMQFELCKPFGVLWTAGRALLMSFRYPWLGGLLLSAMLTLACWLLGYALRLRPRWRWSQWLPLSLYTGIFTHNGLNNYFEAETGQAFGIPACILLILVVWGVMIRSFSRKPSPAFFRIPKDESRKENYGQLAVALCVGLLPAIVYGQMERAYVRPTAHMQVAVMEEDWQEVIGTAEANAEMSYRPFAAQYAIALVQTGQIAERLFNIRLDYDSLHIEGMNGDRQNALSMYQMECDLHAGLVQSAYHHAMENMAMEGPTVRNLKMLCRAALLRNEWELAEKYLAILERVPLEGDFCRKHRAMLRHPQAVESDPMFAVVRQLEPTSDIFENNLTPPVFLGYYASLYEGRSQAALNNSLMVNLYTKATMPFLYRTQMLNPQLLPTYFAQAIALFSAKNPDLLQRFPSVRYTCNEVQMFLNETREYMQERPGITEDEEAELLRLGHTPSGTGTLTSAENRALHARQFFDRYKGFYPYYYFFGNLKATKKKEAKESSNAGVN